MPPIQFSFEIFSPSHYPAARALWEQTPGVGLSAADEPQAIIRFLARNPGLSLVAMDGHALIGTILCGHDGRRGLIHHLVVAEPHRRQNLGRELVRLGLLGLREAGIDKCHILVFRDNESGQAFWRSVAAVERLELSLFSLDVPTGGFRDRIDYRQNS